MPRVCPFCHDRTIIGHGQRLRLAHDDRHERIYLRRGRCCPCRRTFTFLPDWLVPSGHYSLSCRRQACQRIASGMSADQAAPPRCGTLADAATIRRWAGRRVASVWCWFTTLAGRRFFPSPTIFAWDLIAARRMLPFEAKSP